MQTNQIQANQEPTPDDKLRSITAAEGPYLTAIMAGSGPDLVDRFSRRSASLRDRGASEPAVDAIAARLAVPPLDGSAGRWICAAGDGATIAEFLADGPAEDRFHIGLLPRAAPLFASAQARVPHLLIDAHRSSQVILLRLTERPDADLPFTRAKATVEACRTLCERHDIDLIVIGGPNRPARSLARKVRRTVPIRTTVTLVPYREIKSFGDLDTAARRYVADHVARGLVATLQDFRFLLSTNGAVQGVDATVGALARGWGDVLLVHDDPEDGRSVWMGSTPTEISATPLPGWAEVPLVDAAITAAVGLGMDVRILPSTGPDGPDGQIGLMGTDVEPGPTMEALN